MAQQQPKPSSLSEISHLFLTELRQRQTTGNTPPSRKPPLSIDVTPAEFAAGTQSSGIIQPSEEQTAAPKMTVVLGHHLGAAALKSVREYARHLAGEESPIGLIELGEDGMRLTCFDSTSDEGAEAAPAAAVQPVDGKQIRDALAEMSWDIQRWLLYLPAAPQSAAARTLLKQISDWTLLVASSDDSVVAAYRTLKGLAAIGEPKLSLAIVGAEDAAQAEMIHRKFAGAGRQFLNRAIESQGCVQSPDGIAEHVVLWCRASGGTHEHWTAVSEMAAKSAAPEKSANAPEMPEEVPQIQEIKELQEVPMNEPTVSREPEPPASYPFPINPPPASPAPAISMSIAPRATDLDEVVDLPAGAGSREVLASILKQQTHWIASPVKPPFCQTATVAVDRDGSLTLLAATRLSSPKSAGSELSELRTISRAYGWLIENRPLIRMALPQMNIDAAAMPKLTLFVDQADAAGDELGSILQNTHVTLQTYRRVRWGEKTGLLLKAA
jgi:hypothetical protein